MILNSAVKPREIAASTDAPDYAKKVLITNKVTTNFFPTPMTHMDVGNASFAWSKKEVTPLATTLPTSSTADSRMMILMPSLKTSVLGFNNTAN